jgi:uncharacterized membrane protein
MQTWSWIFWNLFLAAIPVGLAYLWTSCVQRYSLKRKAGVPWFFWTPLILLWLAFLPNTCYLLTEWRHFLFDADFVELRGAAAGSRVLMLDVARQGLFFLLYSGFGILCFLFAIRPVELLLQKTTISKAVWMTPLFLLTSLGVYLGLILRFNSWDLITRPARIGHIILSTLSNPLLIKTILIFAVLLWLAYEIANIWADGLALRIKRRQAKPCR